jgi:hypothetical protein
MYSTELRNPLDIKQILVLLVALQPRCQRIREVLPRDSTTGEVRPEVVAVLRIRHGVSENEALCSLLAALGSVGSGEDLGRKGLSAQGRECAPRVELTARPVRVGGANVPAAEDGVGLGDVRPQREQRGGRIGELAVADVTLVGKRVVLGDNLVGAEVGSLEVSCWLLVFAPTHREIEETHPTACSTAMSS